MHTHIMEYIYIYDINKYKCNLLPALCIYTYMNIYVIVATLENEKELSTF